MCKVEMRVCALFAVLGAVCRADFQDTRETAEDVGSGSGGQDDTNSPLSGEAIANITATVFGVSVIGAALCYLLLCFNKDSRIHRVRMAQERNRQITKQIEAVKQKKRAQQLADSGQLETSREEEKRSAGNLLFSQVHSSHEQLQGRESRDSDINPTEPLVPSFQSPIS